MIIRDLDNLVHVFRKIDNDRVINRATRHAGSRASCRDRKLLLAYSQFGIFGIHPFHQVLHIGRIARKSYHQRSHLEEAGIMRIEVECRRIGRDLAEKGLFKRFGIH